jgi:carboxylesterase type B
MEERITVGVAQGDLRGRKTVTASGTTYYSFKGIPYAKPPLGSLRFGVSTQREFYLARSACYLLKAGFSLTY